MKRHILGRTGLCVSEIALGTVEIGMEYGIKEPGRNQQLDSGADRLLQHALGIGINFIDTARAYGNSETIIGRVLGGRRREFVLATKVQTFEQENLTAAERKARMIGSVEQSLRELRTTEVDILMLHSASPYDVSDPSITDTLLSLRERNLCRFIGASLYDASAALKAIRSGVFDCLQIAHSLLDRRPEREVIPEAQRMSVGIISRSILLKGALTHRYRWLPPGLECLKERVQQLEGLLGAEASSLPEIAYRYISSQPFPEVALVGTSLTTELNQAAAFCEKGPLSADLLARIRAMPALDEQELDPRNWPPI